MLQPIGFGPTAGLEDYTPESEQATKQKEYSRLCWKMTNRIAADIPNIHLRKFRGGHHIDHIVPIYLGFKLGIPVALIASPLNLRMLEGRANLAKGKRLTKEAALLLVSWGYTK